MGKRKKGRKSKRRYYRKAKKSVSRRSKTPLAASLGGAKTGYDVLMDGTLTDLKTTLFNPSVTTARVTTQNAWARLKTRSGPALIGLTISYGDQIPVAGKLYRPVKRKLDGMVRKLLGKGFRL